MKGWLVLILMLLLGASPSAQERSPIVLEHANTLSSYEENGVRWQELLGAVRITKDSLTVTCEKAFYYPDSGVVLFRDNVVFEDPHRVLFADEVTYNEFTEEVFASSRVRVYQHDTLSVTCRTARYFERLKQGHLYDDVRMREQNRRLELTGKLGFVDHERRYGRVTQDAVATERDSTLKVVTRVRGDTVEYFEEPKLVRVTGHVQIERDSLTAGGHLLEYFTQQHMAELTGSPRAVRGDDEVDGDTLRMFFEEEKLNRVEVAGNAVATSPADSGVAEPRNRMEGKRMTLWIEDGVISRVRVEGTAIASYYVRDKTEKRGLNVTSGDRLHVLFADRRISRIRVEGGTQGTYTPQKMVAASEAAR